MIRTSNLVLLTQQNYDLFSAVRCPPPPLPSASAVVSIPEQM